MALNAHRIEKCFVHWGHDLAYTDAPHQIDLDFTWKYGKAIPSIGRDAVLKRKAEIAGPFHCSIKLCDVNPLLHHNEPVLSDGDVVRHVTSGAFAYGQGASIGLCMISPPHGSLAKAMLQDGDYCVIVKGEKFLLL